KDFPGLYALAIASGGFPCAQELLDAHYTRIGIDNAEELQGGLHALSRDMSQLLLGYQIASFSRLGAEQWIMPEQQMLDQDQRVLENFTRLSALSPWPERAPADPARQCTFSRQRSFYQAARGVTKAVQRYLGSAMLRMNRVAIELPTW